MGCDGGVFEEFRLPDKFWCDETVHLNDASFVNKQLLVTEFTLHRTLADVTKKCSNRTRQLRTVAVAHHHTCPAYRSLWPQWGLLDAMRHGAQERQAAGKVPRQT